VAGFVSGPVVSGLMVMPGSQVSRGQRAVVNGPVVNGPVVNGPVVNGPVVNGPVVNGPVVNGPVVNGPVVNGPAPGPQPAPGAPC
jgi:hypothetical protein